MFRPDSTGVDRRLLIDVTELIDNPIRTGIQRVVRSLLRHWPDPENLTLCRFTPEYGLVTVSREVFRLLQDPPNAHVLTPIELKGAIGNLLSIGGIQPIPSHLPILVPEVFFDFARCAHHLWLLGHAPDRTSFLTFDFIPWLDPESIGVRETAPMMAYVRLLRNARRVGFISATTRRDFVTRIIRRPDGGGPVFALGADGPCIPQQHWSVKRNTYLCIGSVDGRKNQDAVISAFESLWNEGMEARLVLVGRFFAAGHVDDLAARIKRLQALEPRFTYYSDISDDALHGLYGEARATIYASQIEGFGLPPVESLHCGVPVIVYQDLPSVVNLPTHGQIRLRRMSASAIAWGVRLLQDDEFAARLWAGAGTIPTTEWSDVASDVAHWAVSR